MREDYFTAKKDMADIIDCNFQIRKKSLSNIARLYDDAMPCCLDIADRYVAEIHFHYMIWKKFNGLSKRSLQHIKQITHTVLAMDADFFSLNAEEYADFIKLATELNTADISILTDKNMDQS